MPINSKQKGSAGERELAAFFKQHGYSARRGQQFSGSPDSPDIVHDIPWLHVECKRTEALSVYTAFKQAIEDGGLGKVPLVAHRRNERPWLAIMPLSSLLKLIKKAGPLSFDDLKPDTLQKEKPQKPQVFEADPRIEKLLTS